MATQNEASSFDRAETWWDLDSKLCPVIAPKVQMSTDLELETAKAICANKVVQKAMRRQGARNSTKQFDLSRALSVVGGALRAFSVRGIDSKGKEVDLRELLDKACKCKLLQESTYVHKTTNGNSPHRCLI